MQDSATRFTQYSKIEYEEADRLSFFQILQSGFRDSLRSVEAIDYYYKIAGQTICLRFAGNSLADKLTQALAHLQTASTVNPDLTVCLWDSQSTGRNLPHFIDSFLRNMYCHPVIRHERGGRGEIFSLNSDRFRAALNGPHILTMLDFVQKTAIFWMPDCNELPDYERGAPLKTILHWWFSSPICQMIHAGAVGNKQGGVLLTGQGGSGKSTTALNCLNSSLSYASDDYVLVEAEPNPIAYSVFNTAKVKTREDLLRFNHLSSWAIGNDPNEKTLMFVNQNAPEKIITELPIKAIICPRFIKGEKIQLQEISVDAAFQSVSTSTIMQMPNANMETLRMMRQLVKKLPNYSLVFGEMQDEIPENIQQVISKHS